MILKRDTRKQIEKSLSKIRERPEDRTERDCSQPRSNHSIHLPWLRSFSDNRDHMAIERTAVCHRPEQNSRRRGQLACPSGSRWTGLGGAFRPRTASVVWKFRSGESLARFMDLQVACTAATAPARTGELRARSAVPSVQLRGWRVLSLGRPRLPPEPFFLFETLPPEFRKM